MWRVPSIFAACVLILIFSSQVFCAKILIFHGICTYSHRVQTWPIAEALVEKGHNVSYLAPYYPKTPNPKIHDFVPKAFAKFMEEEQDSEFDVNFRVEMKMPAMIDTGLDLAYNSYDILLSSPEMKEWMKEHEKEPFDLFIIDNDLPECGIALAHIMGVKFILFSTVALIPHEYDLFGFLPMSSAIPEMETFVASTPLDFFGRVSNTLLSLKWRYHHWRYTAKMDELITRKLNVKDDMPSVDDIIRNASLIFSTGNVVVDYPRSLPPMFVDISGIHLKESSQPLPKHLEEFVSSNKTGEESDGFIYISLGSMAVSSNLPENIKNVFFSVMKAFPNLKFMWKWNGDFPTEIPKNLMLGKWFPQFDVLAHPKIRGFITQGGRPSSLEALYNSVPMITFPVFGDQDLNTQRMSETGAAIKFELGELTFEKLRDAVQRIAFDPSVKKRMTKLQTIFRDRPMTPLQTALWWTEYVLRSEDTTHLHPYGNDQYWFVRRQVDVWAFLTIVVLSVAVAVLKVAGKIVKISNGEQRKKEKVT